MASELQFLPFRRWVCLLFLLSAEFLAVSLRYDARGIAPDRIMSGVIMYAGEVARFGIVVGLVTLMVTFPGASRFLKQAPSRLRHERSLIPAVAGNLAAFLCFYALSALVLEGSGSRPSELALVFAWMLAGLATLIFWSFAVLPVSLWAELSQRLGWDLLTGPLLGVAAYSCGVLARDQWKTLSRATLQFSAFLLHCAFRDTYCDVGKAIVGTPAFAVQIAPVCSGYEGMALIGAMLAIYLWIYRREMRLPRALVLLPVGMALMWVANAVRIAALLALGALGYPEIAQGGFHSLAGWVFFLLIGLGLVAFARSSPFFSVQRDGTSETDAVPVAHDGAYLVPGMVIIAISMVTTSFWPGFDRFYPVRVIAAVMALLLYRKSYSELRPRWSWEAIVIGCGVFAFWMALEPLAASPTGGSPMQSGLQSLGSFGATAWLILRVIGSVVTVPIAEELAFRGYLTRRLITPDFQSIPPGRMTWWSLLVSSLIFGVLHGRWFAGTLAGIAYAWVYRRRGELSDSILAHAVTNALIALTVLTTGSWSLWS